MKNWIKAFLIVCLSIFALCLLINYIPYVVIGIAILTIVGGIIFLVKMILDDYGSKNN